MKTIINFIKNYLKIKKITRILSIFILILIGYYLLFINNQAEDFIIRFSTNTENVFNNKIIAEYLCKLFNLHLIDYNILIINIIITIILISILLIAIHPILLLILAGFNFRYGYQLINNILANEQIIFNKLGVIIEKKQTYLDKFNLFTEALFKIEDATIFEHLAKINFKNIYPEIENINLKSEIHNKLNLIFESNLATNTENLSTLVNSSPINWTLVIAVTIGTAVALYSVYYFFGAKLAILSASLNSAQDAVDSTIKATEANTEALTELNTRVDSLNATINKTNEGALIHQNAVKADINTLNSHIQAVDQKVIELKDALIKEGAILKDLDQKAAESEKLLSVLKKLLSRYNEWSTAQGRTPLTLEDVQPLIEEFKD